MTYGVDQCRVCGTRIHPKGPEVAEEQMQANRKPLMPEKEWRRRGYLCPPTKFQIRQDPSNGCCHKCGMRELQKFSKYGVLTFSVAGGFLVAVIILVIIVTYIPH